MVPIVRAKLPPLPSWFLIDSKGHGDKGLRASAQSQMLSKTCFPKSFSIFKFSMKISPEQDRKSASLSMLAERNPHGPMDGP